MWQLIQHLILLCLISLQFHHHLRRLEVVHSSQKPSSSFGGNLFKSKAFFLLPFSLSAGACASSFLPLPSLPLVKDFVGTPIDLFRSMTTYTTIILMTIILVYVVVDLNRSIGVQAESSTCGSDGSGRNEEAHAPTDNEKGRRKTAFDLNELPPNDEGF
ncbi:hypothetical protein QL285_043361 [Trifolium repens]|nr:hypothetical protein QL285_043361 [Trifolium repens]